MYILRKIAAYYFVTCEWHLLSGMTLQIASRQSLDDCVTVSDNAAKYHKVKTIEANLSARKMTSNVDVVSAIEKNLISISASYSYLETTTKKFLATMAFKS